MRGMRVGVREENEEASGKREVNNERGESWASLLVHAHHKRSKRYTL